jgi:hypothetical protein
MCQVVHGLLPIPTVLLYTNSSTASQTFLLDDRCLINLATTRVVSMVTVRLAPVTSHASARSIRIMRFLLCTVVPGSTWFVVYSNSISVPE